MAWSWAWSRRWSYRIGVSAAPGPWETRLLENEAAAQTSADPLDRIANAFSELAAKPSLGLMYRYQTRLHLNYQRALHNMLLLRAATAPMQPDRVLDIIESGE